MQLRLSDLVGGGYTDFWYCKKRYRVCKGSRGSKKSKTSALNMIMRLIKYPLSNALCVRRYSTTLRDSVFSDLKWAISQLHLDADFRYTTSPMQITRISTGQKILFRGLDDGLKITSITVDKGYLCWVWIEEAYEITNEDDFNKLDMSIRGKLPSGYFKQITLTFNPWSANHWIKHRFFDHPDNNTFIKTTTYKCNEWLDDADRKLFDQMKESNPRRYRIEGLGEWGIAEGLIYENVKVEPIAIDAMRKQPGRYKSAYGLDFGYTDPNAFVCLLIDQKEKKIYVFDEWYKTGCTNQQIAEQIKRMGYGSERIIGDCAEPKSLAELREEGIRAEASRKGRDSVNYGIQLIQNYQIIIDSHCVEFYKEISNYCWKTNQGRLTEQPEHEFSHGMDAMRYAVTKAIMPDRFSFD